MISAIGIASGNLVDSEYLRIIQELRRFGISPSGNKSTDKSRLEQAKAELINKIHKKETENTSQTLQIQPQEPVDEAENAKKSELEIQRLGAMNLAELNKLYFRL